MEDFEVHPIGTGEVLRQLRAEREALEVRRADLAHERDAWMKSCDHKQAEVLNWEKRYMALLESIANLKATQTPIIYFCTDEGTYLKGKE